MGFPDGPVVKTFPSNAEGTGLIHSWGTKILHALRHGQKKKKIRKNHISLLYKKKVYFLQHKNRTHPPHGVAWVPRGFPRHLTISPPFQELSLLKIMHLKDRRASLVAQWYRIHLQCRRPGFNCWVRKVPWRSDWLPTLVLFPGESHGQRSLESYSTWGCSVGYD